MRGKATVAVRMVSIVLEAGPEGGSTWGRSQVIRGSIAIVVEISQIPPVRKEMLTVPDHRPLGTAPFSESCARAPIPKAGASLDIP